MLPPLLEQIPGRVHQVSADGAYDTRACYEAAHRRGAQVAIPDAIVVDIAGDSSIQMNIQEMATAVQSGLPVKIVILNNGYMGMVRQWQELFYEKRYVSTCMDCAPDFVKLAEAYGAVGLRATKPEEVESVLAEGLKIPEPVIMEFLVEKEEGVYPMVPAGAAITEMLLV